MVFILRQLQEKGQEIACNHLLTSSRCSTLWAGKESVANHETTWSSPRVSRHGYPTPQRSAQPSQTWQQPFRAFPIASGIKQSCVLAPTLLHLQHDAPACHKILTTKIADSVYDWYRTDGSLFNLRCLQAHTVTLEQLFWELLFVDAAAIVAHTEKALQHSVLLCRGCTTLSTGSQPEQDRSLASALTSGCAAPSAHHLWPVRAEKCSSVQLPRVHDLSGCQVGQGYWQSTSKASSAFGSLHKKVWGKQTSEEGHQDQCVPSSCTDLTPVWCWVVGYLLSPPMTSRTLSSGLPPLHP